ncbi:alpha-related fimbriae major subunit [Yersinia enterocolitica]|nr:alpha-related fimbriae major subunit [Yersinia enterocolitica]
MNTTSKKLLMGLLLLILHPAAMANALFYDYTQSYSNCSVKLLDDGSVKVSFQANLTDGLFGNSCGWTSYKLEKTNQYF